MVQFANLDSQYGFPEGTIRSLIQQESGGRANAVSSAGARGYTQFMPATRTEMIERHGLDPWSQDINVAAKCAAIYLSEQCDKFGGDVKKGLAAYNAGAGNVKRAVREGGSDWLSRLRPETRNYVPSILGRLGIEMGELDQAEDYDRRRAAGQTTPEQDRLEEARRRDLYRRGGLDDSQMSPEQMMNQFVALFIGKLIEHFIGQVMNPNISAPTSVATGADVAPVRVTNSPASTSTAITSPPTNVTSGADVAPTPIRIAAAAAAAPTVRTA